MLNYKVITNVCRVFWPREGLAARLSTLLLATPARSTDRKIKLFSRDHPQPCYGM